MSLSINAKTSESDETPVPATCCPRPHPVFDGRERYCENCGAVFREENPVLWGSEARPEPARNPEFAAAVTLEIRVAGASPIHHFSPQFYHLLRAETRSHPNPRDRRLGRCFAVVMRSAQLASVPHGVALKALRRAPSVHSHLTDDELKAILFIEARRAGLPVRLRSFARDTGVSRLGATEPWRILGRRVRDLSRELHLAVPQVGPGAFLERFAEPLSLSPHFQREVVDFLEEKNGAVAYSNGDPLGVLAAAVWLVSKAAGPVIPQERIAEVMEVTTPTIREHARELARD